jgi:hypothetical protein
MASDLSKVVTSSGGSVVGEVRHPLNTSDFSSFLLRAQSSKAQIIGLASAGADTINSVKQAAEYRIAAGGQKLAGLVVVISDIHALGLATARGYTGTGVATINGTAARERSIGLCPRDWTISTTPARALPSANCDWAAASTPHRSRRSSPGRVRRTCLPPAPGCPSRWRSES